MHLLATKLTGKRNRARAVTQLLRLQSQHERALAPRIEKVLSTQVKTIAMTLRSGGIDDVVTYLRTIGAADLHRELVAGLTVAFEVTGQAAIDSISGKKKTSDSAFNAARDKYLRGVAGKKIVQVTDSTVNYIRDQLDAAVNAGDSIVDMANRIEDQIDGIGFLNPKQRAFMISRTETHAASVSAMEMAVRTSGYDVIREWAAVVDDRSRDGHADADGQERAMDEPFDIDGGEMDFPGDPNAPAEHVINCRCQVLYRRAV